MAVMYASKIYILPILTERCRKFLVENMCQGNVCTILEQSVLYGEDLLVERCLKFIAPIVEPVFSAEDFLNLSQPALKTLIQYDFYCENEMKVYESCLQWAKEQCKKKELDVTDENLRTVLGDVIYQIRFASMQNANFTKIARQSDILTDKEKLDVCLLRMCDESTKEDLVQNSKFNHQPRCSSLITFDRFESVEIEENVWDYNNPYTDAIAFKSNKKIKLVGLSVFGGTEGAEHSMKVEIKDSDMKVLSELDDVRVVSDGTFTHLPIYLIDPVTIDPDQTYHAAVTVKGPTSHYGTGGQEKITENGICLEITDSSLSSNGSKVGVGQIPQLIVLPII